MVDGLTNELKNIISFSSPGAQKTVQAIDNVNKKEKELGKSVSQVTDKQLANSKIVKKTSFIYDSFGKQIGVATQNLTKYNYTNGNTTIVSGKVTEKLNNNVSSLSKFTHSLKNTEKTLNTFRWAMVNAFFIGGTVALLASPIIALTKFGMELEDMYKKIEVVTGTSMESAKQSIEELRQGTFFSLQEMGGAFLEFTKAGFTTQEAMEAMPYVSALATVGFTDMDTAVRITAQSLHQFGLQASDTEDVVNILVAAANKSAADVEGLGLAFSYSGSLASQAGMSYEETAASLAILTNVGLRNQKAGTALNAMLTQMLNPTEELENKMGRLGITFFNTEGEMKTLSVIVEELSTALFNMPEKDKLEFLIDLFGKIGGRGALGFINSFEEGGETIDEFTKTLEEATDAMELMEDVGTTASKKLKKSWEDFKTSVLAPTGEVLAEQTSGLLDVLSGKAFKDIWDSSNLIGKSLVNMLPEESLDVTRRMFGIQIDDSEPISANIQNKQVSNKKRERDDTLALTLAMSGYKKILSDVREEIEKSQQDSFIKDITSYINDFNEAIDKHGDLVDTTSLEGTISNLNAQIEEYKELSTELETANANYKDQKIVVDNLKESYADKKDELSEYKDVLSEINSEIRELSSPRFTGQLEVERLIEKAELYLKKQDLASRGITDSQQFLQDALEASADGYDDLFSSMERVNNEANTNMDTYEAWRETVMEFIRDTVRAGNELGKNTSDAVTKYATLLLSTSKFGDKQEKQEDLISNLRDAYDVYYGEMIGDVNYAVQAHEEEGRTIFDTSSQVISSLNQKWVAQKKYTDILEDTQDELSEISEEVENATDIYDDYRKKIEEATVAMEKLKEETIAQVSAATGGTTGGTTDGGGGGSTDRDREESTSERFYFMNSRFKVKSMRSGSGTSRSARKSDAISKLPDDYSWSSTDSSYWKSLDFRALANGGLITKPTVALMGEAGPEMVVPMDKSTGLPKGGAGLGNITISNVTINGVSGNPSDFAYEFSKALRRELKTI